MSLFQLVNISEYHVQQMQENAPSIYPESDDDSQSSEDRHFASAVAMIYYSKVITLHCCFYWRLNSGRKFVYTVGLHDAVLVVSYSRFAHLF